MKRRAFLKKAAALPILLNGLPAFAMARPFWMPSPEDSEGRVLVLVQLNGGNDGLNTIVPLDQYSVLSKVRGNILIPERRVLSLTDSVGLHPSMEGISRLFKEGKTRIVQSVGYPDQNRSHFRSTDIWTTASPSSEIWTRGWVGRYLESRNPEYPLGYPNEEMPDPFALTLSSVVSETCQGTATNFSLALEDPFALRPLAEGEGGNPPDSPYGRELDFLRNTIAQTNAYSGAILKAANGGSNLAVYPGGNSLARQLRQVALLISGGLKTQIYVVRLGGFDTHAAQVVGADTTTGEHATLLSLLSEAMTAFQEDLRLHGLEERVLTMTFSEFGRQIRSNFSLGTDHGTAAPLLLFGSCIRPGILGENPEIPGEPEEQEGVAMQYDFRDVYGSVLQDWFGVADTEIRQLIHGDYQHLPLIQNCLTTSTTAVDEVDSDNLSVFPNPFGDQALVRFRSPGGRIRLSLFDMLGHEVRLLVDQDSTRVEQELSLSGQGLAPGNYALRLRTEQGVKTRLLVKR